MKADRKFPRRFTTEDYKWEGPHGDLTSSKSCSGFAGENARGEDHYACLEHCTVAPYAHNGSRGHYLPRKALLYYIFPFVERWAPYTV